MNELLESAKNVLKDIDRMNLVCVGSLPKSVNELRQAVNEAERKQALTELTKLSQELGLYEENEQ